MNTDSKISTNLQKRSGDEANSESQPAGKRSRGDEHDWNKVTLIHFHNISRSEELDVRIRFGPKSTIMDVLSAMFKFSLTRLLSGETLNSHLWELRHKSDTTMKEWYATDFDDPLVNSRFQIPNESPENEEYPVHMSNKVPFETKLSELELTVDDVMMFKYDSYGSSNSRLSLTVSAFEEYEPTNNPDHENFPMLCKDDTQLQCSSNNPLQLTAAEIEAGRHFRQVRLDQGEYEFSRSQRQIIPAQSPEWTMGEYDAMAMLIAADYKFTKAWTLILEHTLLNRSKAATSGKWYDIKKGRYDYRVRDIWSLRWSKTSDELVRLACQQLRCHRRRIINQPLRTPQFRNEGEYMYDLYAQWERTGPRNPHWHEASEQQKQKYYAKEEEQQKKKENVQANTSQNRNLDNQAV